MLVGILRSRTLVAFVAALFTMALFLINAGLQIGSDNSSHDLLFTHWAFGWTDSFSPSVLTWIGCAIVLVYTVLSRSRFRETADSLGSVNLATVIMLSIITTQQLIITTRPDILVSAILINAAYLLLFYTYKKESVLSQLFHNGLFIGLAALFVGQSIVMVAATLFALFILRSGRGKEVVVLFLGLIMTLVFVALFLVWNDRPFLAFQQLVQTSWVSDVQPLKMNLGHIALFIGFALALMAILRDTTAATVHERNVALVNIGWIIGVLLMVALLGLGWQAGIVLAAFPISTFISRSLESINRWWLADLMLIILIAAPFLRSLWQL